MSGFSCVLFLLFVLFAIGFHVGSSHAFYVRRQVAKKNNIYEKNESAENL